MKGGIKSDDEAMMREGQWLERDDVERAIG